MLPRSLLAFAAPVILGFATLGTASAQAPSTLAQIKQRNALNCGVDTGLAGFAFKDDKGVWKGLDVDYCRAIAAAWTLGYFAHFARRRFGHHDRRRGRGFRPSRVERLVLYLDKDLSAAG